MDDRGNFGSCFEEMQSVVTEKAGWWGLGVAFTLYP